MLVVSRKEGECIGIEPAEGLDGNLTLRDVFAYGPIVVKVTHVGRRVRLVIDAPPELKISRGSSPAPTDAAIVPAPGVAATAASALLPNKSS